MLAAMRMLAALPALAIALALAGCPKITSFKTTPQLACKQQPVTITWETKGDTTLSSNAPVAGLTDECKKNKKCTVTIQGKTRFTLKVERLLGTRTAERDVSVLGEERELGGDITGCDAQEMSVAFSTDPQQYSAGARVGWISARNLTRTLIINHEDRTVELRPDAPGSEGLNGTSVLGDWLVKSPHKPNETCDTQQETSLSFWVAFACEQPAAGVGP
jgi:hypothetical protein